MPSWPLTLPDAPLLDHAQYAYEEVRAIFESDSGPPIMRARTTSAGETSDVTWGMTSAQLTTFNTFYKTTLSNGSSSFTMNYIIDDTTQTFLFLKAPTIHQVTDGYFRVTASLYMEA